MLKTVKEIIIMLLVCLLVMLALAIALYNYIPNKKIVPEVSTYTASSEVKECLNDNVTDKRSEVILTYEVTSSDLNTYKNINEYVPGKTNPFAQSSTQTEENTETSNENSTNGQSSSGAVQNTTSGSNTTNNNQTNSSKNTGTK